MHEVCVGLCFCLRFLFLNSTPAQGTLLAIFAFLLVMSALSTELTTPTAHGYEPANVHGRALFTSLDFWLLFVIVSTCEWCLRFFNIPIPDPSTSYCMAVLIYCHSDASHLQ